MLGYSASDLISQSPDAPHGRTLFDQMMRDLSSGGQQPGCPLTHASYAMGYNLAIEFLADYEKRWMLQSYRKLNERVLAKQGLDVDWLFLEVCPLLLYVATCLLLCQLSLVLAGRPAARLCHSGLAAAACQRVCAGACGR